MADKASLLIKCAVPDLALFDLGSPANRAGHYQEAWKSAWRFMGDRHPGATKDGDLDTADESFEQYWNLRQQDGELLVWSAGTGVFRVEVRLLPEAPRKAFTAAQKKAFLAGQDVDRVLHCPKGELAVAGLKSLGADAKTLLKVPPGDYLVGLDVDEASRKKHWPLDEISTYPPEDGPDYVLLLQKKA